MFAKIIGGLALAVSVSLAGLGASRFVGENSCCFFGSDCCNPPQACCFEDCCYPGSPCCDVGEPCCLTEKTTTANGCVADKVGCETSEACRTAEIK